MTTAALDYRALVSQIEPKAIHAEEQYERYMAKFLELDARFDSLMSPERDMHELLSLLISHYEKRAINIQAPTPIEAVETLMEANGLKQKDLVGVVFETASIASEVLNGKRELTTDHIRRLSHRFEVSPAIFLG